MSRDSANVVALGGRVESKGEGADEFALLSCSTPKTFYVPGTIFTSQKNSDDDNKPQKVTRGFAAPGAKPK